MSAPTATPVPTETAADEAAVLLPSDVFFVRRVPLDPAGDAAMQVELALESSAPFAVAQLYYGYLRADDGASALIFATHRRLFAEESWDGASVVLPDFVALLGEPPAGARVRLWREGSVAVAVGFDGAALPAVVLGRKLIGFDANAEIAELVDEVQRRLGVAASVDELSGLVRAEPTKDGQVFSLQGTPPAIARFTEAQLATMDVRDKAVLSARRAAQRRDRLLWRVFLAAAVLGLVAGVLELGRFAGRMVVDRQRAAERATAPEVEKIQTAQTLGTRIEEMSQRRLRAFEMLAVINAVRPQGLMFTRAVTNGRDMLEVEGQSANSDNVGAYESALRGLPQLASVEFPDVRLREGVTTFQFSVRFKDGALNAIAGTETEGVQP